MADASQGSDNEEETEYCIEEADDGLQIEEDEEENPHYDTLELHIDEVIEVLEVNEYVFEELRLAPDIVQETQEAWRTFIGLASSRDAAGEAIYSAIFESAPTLQGLFKTPRPVMAMRFMNGLNNIISSMNTSSALKVIVETLGFQHLDLDVTVPRVGLFRDAVTELFEQELAERFSSKARSGLKSIFNYVGGAFIFIRREYAGRIKIIGKSWRTANNKVEGSDDGSEEDGQTGQGDATAGLGFSFEEAPEKATITSSGSKDGEEREARDSDAKKTMDSMKVPTTFNEMFLFNAAVMGFSTSTWMQMVLEQFGAIVSNVANSYRLQEECDILALRLAKHKGQKIYLNEFKAVMLAALRSLVPREWSSEHEVAWCWLWENVERLLRQTVGKPTVQARSLERFIRSLTDEALTKLRSQVYERFFQVAPAGQDHFKQSTSRLHFIADKVFEMTLEIYHEPRRMVEDISALGLRHVGYAIPTELFAPFVSCFVESVNQVTSDEVVQEAFRWSLTLISKMLVRTILEGSTVVMKAVNANSEQKLRKAIAIAPRAQRSVWLLNITVGSQSISPLDWALQSGSLKTAKAMLQDLLTIRADRDNYFYGCDELFSRHPDIIKRVVDSEHLTVLLDGLIWRSRLAIKGKRRVNYYVKHLLVNSENGVNKALRWIVQAGNPKSICHPAVVLFSDLLWSRLACTYFLCGRLGMLSILICFVVSQSVLPRLHEVPTEAECIAMFVLRLFVYISSFAMLTTMQLQQCIEDIKKGEFAHFRGLAYPQYLADGKERLTLALVLTLIVMAAQEPILYCITSWEGDFPGAGPFTQRCPAGLARKDGYSTASMIALFLYFARITDLSILSTWASAFLLVCARMLQELSLFLMALVALVLAFSTSVSVLHPTLPDFSRADHAAVSFSEIALGMYPRHRFMELRDLGILMALVCLFMVISLVFLLNLLVAQLNTAYQSLAADMVGFARLNRGKITVEMLASITQKRWERFLETLHLDERLEFNEGDIGLAGGIQVLEEASLNPTNVERIRRYGGSTCGVMPWPEDHHDEECRLERLEKMMSRAVKHLSRDRTRHPSRLSSGGGSSLSSASDEPSSDGGGSNTP